MHLTLLSITDRRVLLLLLLLLCRFLNHYVLVCLNDEIAGAICKLHTEQK